MTLEPNKPLRLGPLPIMIVDDDPDILKLLSNDLKSLAAVETFQDPVEALKAFESRPYCVVLSDLSMGSMSGLELLEKCFQLRPQSQRILLTAFVDLANLPDSINRAKLNFLLAKPWNADDLRAVVSEAVRSNDLERENQELRRMALTDSLTGIANHRYFWERLDSEFARAHRHTRNLSLIMCDVDNFKKFNDEKGHPFGDEILRRCAQTLEEGKRAADTVARYGGEEFVIILPEVGPEKAIEIANRHLGKVRSMAGITLSFGVASFPQNAQSTTALVDLADKALLAAKARGKACVVSANDIEIK